MAYCTLDDRVIEAAAKAAYRHECPEFDLEISWRAVGNSRKDYWRKKARTALTAAFAEAEKLGLAKSCYAPPSVRWFPGMPVLIIRLGDK